MLIPMAAAFVCVCLYCRRSCIVISFTRTVGSMRDLSAILIPRGFVMRAGKQLFFFRVDDVNFSSGIIIVG